LEVSALAARAFAIAGLARRETASTRTATSQRVNESPTVDVHDGRRCSHRALTSPSPLTALLLSGEARHKSGLFVGLPEFLFGDDPVDKSRISKIHLDDQLTRLRHARRQRDVMPAHLDLLMRDFE
jgi:hypothetical protein